MFDTKNYSKRKKNETNLISIGLNFSAGVALFFYFGYLADNYFQYKFIFKIIGLFLGIFGATYKLIKDVKKLDGREQN